MVLTSETVDKGNHGLGTIPRLLREIVTVPGKNKIQISELYRGLGPNLVGNTASWSVYFVLYQKFVSLSDDPSAQTYLYSSLAAGTLTSFLTNPLWVLKTRMLSTSARVPGAYSSMLEGIKRILVEEGIRGFWRGFTPSLFGIGQTAIQFSLYDSFKSSRLKDNDDKTLPTSDYIILSAGSKLISTCALYPYQLVRSRLQTYRTNEIYRSAWDVITKVYRNEGMKGMYKGLAANLLRVVPSTCTTLVVYESVKNHLL